ncbi:TIM-barrel domain-containing protein [Sphingomonas sp. MMS24-JH45]
MEEALLDHGIDATWNDNNEYEIWDARARFAGFGNPRAAVEMRPVQPMLMMRASRRAQTEVAPEAALCRHPVGHGGLQRYAQTWSGDNRTEWKSLRYNARASRSASRCRACRTADTTSGASTGRRP